MFTTPITKLKAACLHQIGSRTKNEGVVLSASPLLIDDTTVKNLMMYCFSSFREEELFCFFNELGLGYNEVYSCAKSIFNAPSSLIEFSQDIARFLYEKSDHPNIKPGRLIVAYFSDCEVDGVITDAIGLFKSEEDTEFLSMSCDKGKSSIITLKGLDIKKVDKAALIFNVGYKSGYSIAVIDSVNKTNEAKYWIEDFLHIRKIANEYLQTKTVLAATKSFITQQLPQEFEVTKAEQAALMNRSVDFFRKYESFELSAFSDAVISDEKVVNSYSHYLSSFLQDNDIDIPDSFRISETAVHKQTRSIRSVIKLDKNFHIYVHGGEHFIKRGYDEETGMPYYQLFFKEEN